MKRGVWESEGERAEEDPKRWTKENRVRYDRDQFRYPSDTTEAEWEQLAAQIPPARRGGRRRTVNIREVLKGLL